MADLKVSICRLCLKVTPESDFKSFNEEYEMYITYVVPEVNISTSNSPIICKDCTYSMRESYNFKTACVEIESYLQRFVIPMKQLNLNEAISDKMFEAEVEQNLVIVKGENRIICRLCLTVIEAGSFKEFGVIEENILQKCIPEVDLALTERPVSCENCMEYLQSQFNFIMKCLDIDEIINRYLTTKNINTCDLHEVLECLPERYIENGNCLGYIHDYDMPNDKTDPIKKEVDDFNPTVFKIKAGPLAENCMPVLSSMSCSERAHIKEENSSASKVLHKCEVCPYVTNRKHSLRIHMLIHKKTEEITLYKCPECPHETKRKSNLLVHLLKHKNPNDIKMHQCRDCSYQTRLRSNLIKHELIHKQPEEITMHRCQNCLYQTKLKGNLIIHMIQHKSPEELVMHKCSECPYTTKLKNNLKKHILIHRNPEEVTMYKCTQCDYQSKWKSHLMRHRNLHNSGEVNNFLHKCDQCPYVGNQKYNLSKHLLTHKTADEVPMHKCDLCDFHTKRKDKIKQHMDNMHNCSICGYQTKEKKELNIHVESHAVVKEIFKCDVCAYEAKQKRYLQRHKKKAHF